MANTAGSKIIFARQVRVEAISQSHNIIVLTLSLSAQLSLSRCSSLQVKTFNVMKRNKDSSVPRIRLSKHENICHNHRFRYQTCRKTWRPCVISIWLKADFHYPSSRWQGGRSQFCIAFSISIQTAACRPPLRAKSSKQSERLVLPSEYV
jgi:hypothetical protein